MLNNGVVKFSDERIFLLLSYFFEILHFFIDLSKALAHFKFLAIINYCNIIVLKFFKDLH